MRHHNNKVSLPVSIAIGAHNLSNGDEHPVSHILFPFSHGYPISTAVLPNRGAHRAAKIFYCYIVANDGALGPRAIKSAPCCLPSMSIRTSWAICPFVRMS
jgi:hypothetical protein